jgi:hypothetical protein
VQKTGEKNGTRCNVDMFIKHLRDKHGMSYNLNRSSYVYKISKRIECLYLEGGGSYNIVVFTINEKGRKICGVNWLSVLDQLTHLEPREKYSPNIIVQIV